MHVKFLETLDWSILIAYFLILIAIGIWASTGLNTKCGMNEM